MAGADYPYARAHRSAANDASTQKGDRQLAKTAYPSFARTRSLKNSVWYSDHHLISFLATKEDTGGQFGLIEAHSLKGGEPPLHIHHHEDESFYILAGEIDFFVAGQRVSGRAGDYVFVPRGTEHTYALRTEEARVLIISAPAGLEDYFQELGRPAEALTLPASSNGSLDAERMDAAARKYGSEFTRE